MKLFPTRKTLAHIRPLEIMGSDQDAAAPSLIRDTWRIVLIAFLPLIAWSFLAQIEDVAHVPGQVVPSGSIQVVQHLEGGVIQEVLVKDNQVVEKDQLMFRLDGAQDNAELEQVEAKITGLKARAIRAKAFANQVEPDFSSIPARFQDLAEGQKRIYANQVQSLQNNQAVIQAQIAQRKVELQSLRSALDTAHQQVALTGKMVAIRQTLLEKKAISRIIYLETLKANNTAQGEVKRLLKQIDNIQGALNEANSRLNQLLAETERVANDELTSVTNELAQIIEQRVELAERVSRLEIFAPVKGIVQEVNIFSKVVQPGDVLAKIVPMEDKLQVEIRIAPKDVGRINTGELVTIKLSSYSFVFFGRVFGTLSSISPSTVLDEQQQAYFKGIVKLEKNYLGDTPGQNPILPGMLAQVDIGLGDRRAIEILWQPVFDTINDAFKEH